MKRIAIILLITLLVLCSCSQQGDLPSPESHDSQSDTGGQSSNITGSESNALGDGWYPEIPRGYYVVDSDKDDYDRWIRPVLSSDKPSNFIAYDEIESCGQTEFEKFYQYCCEDTTVVDPINTYTRYGYDFRLIYALGYSQKASITVLHGDLSESFLTENRKQKAIEKGALPALYFHKGNTVVTDHEGDDLRYYSGGFETVDYLCNGIRYTYEGGNLTTIHFQSGDTKFWLTFDEPLYASAYGETDQGSLTHPLLFRFLNKDQTATAIQWFDELITSEKKAES